MKFEGIEKSILTNLPIADEKKVIFQRRINKFRESPLSFLEGSYRKRTAQVREHLPIKYSGSNSFTVVSAVYNVEKYLDDYFNSLVRQTLNFKKHIKIILVDDGSEDNSAAVIKNWQAKYPNNIQYIYKENGGQSTARNIGMEHVKTKWVTFIDPDDFINLDYFREIDIAVSNHQDTSMIVTNINFFIENTGTIKKTHPLRYRFNGSVRKVKNDNLNKYINLSSSATIFDNDLITNSNLKFDSNVKPNFEDGRFIAEYLILARTSSSIFLNDAIYFYRKREDGTSTLDTAWMKKEKYEDVLVYGFLNVLERYYTEYGFIPRNIQNTILYDLSWYIQYLINKPEKINFLSEDEKKAYYKLYKKVFYYIDEDVIFDFKLAGTWFFHKVGMLGAFKDKEPPFQIFYVENVDKDKKQILISMFSYFNLPYSFKINNIDTIPSHSKVVAHEFNGETFVYESRWWVSYSDDKDQLSISTGRKTPIKISIHGEHYSESIQIKSLLNRFIRDGEYVSNGSWLLMDRETGADDNAEHLYRYLMNNQPQIECVFALNRSSVDWERLKIEGFNLVDFGSKDFEDKLRQCSKIVSSHLEAHINNYFGDNYGFSKKFVFLQHGVIKDDLSAWINTKKLLNCFITSTKPEYESLLSSESRYKITNKEVVLTGLPRHDSLLERTKNTDNTILVMPTWRHYIVGEVVGKGANERTNNKDFMSTNYAKSWSSFLNSEKLAELINYYDYNIIFAPHANIAPYLNEFSLPPYIEVWDANNSQDSMQEIFQKSKLLVTDYSSVAFEMGFLHKPSLYYQFDLEEFSSGIHTYQQGYFSYEEHGFGPVVFKEEELLTSLEYSLKHNCELVEPFKTRILETFSFRDGRNCERVYEAILALDEMEEQEIDIDILYEMTLSAYTNESWELLESRSILLIEYGDEEHKERAKALHTESLFNQNKFIELFDFLELNDVQLKQERYWKAKVAFATANWQDAIDLIGDVSTQKHESIFMLLLSYASLGNAEGFESLVRKIKSSELDQVQSIMIQAWFLRLNEQWSDVIQLLEESLFHFNLQQLREYQPQILMAQAYRHVEEYTEAHQKLIDFESHSSSNINCRIEIARLAFSRENYYKCINQYEQAVNGAINMLSEKAVLQYLLSHWNMGNIEELNNILPSIISVYIDNIEFNSLYIRVLAKQQKWKEVIQSYSKIESGQRANLIYQATLAKYRLGLIEEAHAHSIKPTFEHPYEYWSLISEIALLVEDKELAEYCYKGMIAIYPNYDNLGNWSKLNNLRYKT